MLFSTGAYKKKGAGKVPTPRYHYFTQNDNEYI